MAVLEYGKGWSGKGAGWSLLSPSSYHTVFSWQTHTIRPYYPLYSVLGIFIASLAVLCPKKWGPRKLYSHQGMGLDPLGATGGNPYSWTPWSLFFYQATKLYKQVHPQLTNRHSIPHVARMHREHPGCDWFPAKRRPSIPMQTRIRHHASADVTIELSQGLR